MKTAKILSFTTLIVATTGACVVSSAEEVKDSSTSTEIVSVEGSDLRNEDALRVAVGDFDNVEFLLSAEEMEAIADNVHISLNGVSTQGGEGSGSSMFFSGDASGQVETTENSSTTFNGALTLASKTNTSETVTSVSSVAMSMSSDDSTEQYATCAGKSYYEQVSTSNSGSAVTTYSATSFLGNSSSVGDGNGGYGTSAIDSGIVPFAATNRTWNGGADYENNWSNTSNWNGSWSNGDNATFDTTGSANNIVTVDTDITAAKITVTGEYIFEYLEGATLTATGNVTIGDGSGTGSLTIAGGTTKFSTSKSYTYIGAGGIGSLTITGGTTTFGGSNSNYCTYVGSNNSSGDGTLTIGPADGGDGNPTVTFSTPLYIGHSGATGTIIINSGTTTFKDKVYLGDNSNSTGYIDIYGGKNEFDGQVYIGGYSASSSGTGHVTISGGENTFKKEVDVGYNGEGALEISGGTNTFEGQVYIAYYTNTTGYVTISGGTNEFKSQVYIGSPTYSSSTGSLTITSGTTVFEGDIEIGHSSTGTMTISGGTTIFEGAIEIGDYGSNNSNGTMTINGGTTTIQGTTTIGNNNSSLSVSGGTVYLETEIGTSANGTVAISGDANIVLSGALLASIEALAEGTANSVDVIYANTITFGDTTFSNSFNGDADYNKLINQYISAEGYDLTWKYDNSSGVLSVVAAVATVAPEPSMFGLFFGLGAIGLVATRRRRRS